MDKFRSVISAAVFATTACLCGMAEAKNDIQLVYSGLALPNGAAPPGTQAFTTWCGTVCFPTTSQAVYVPSTGQAKGAIYVWGKDYQYGTGGSVCFSEFIVFALDDGDVHVASGVNGTCGAPMDPALKPPMYQDQGAVVVIAGGGDGSIVGGTGRYKNWTGTYTDRVFVGFGAPSSGVGGIIYYDQLWFSISGR